MKKKVKKGKKAPKRIRRYGMTKVRKGQKTAWVSVQNRNGWSLGLAFEKYTVWLRNVRFASKEEVSRATDGQKLVFIEKKGNR